SFDAAGDGYVRSEGCGVVLLKRLPDALRDGDRIRAVIRGSAANHNGRGASITRPNPDAIEEVVRQSLRSARLRPGDIDFIEAHGVGSPVSDGAEVGALARVFASEPAKDTLRGPVVLGAVKANVGHLEAASGMVSLLKVVLS